VIGSLHFVAACSIEWANNISHTSQARFGAGMYTGHSLATYTLEKHLNGSEKNPVPGGSLVS
jgi:hypothetical protein